MISFYEDIFWIFWKVNHQLKGSSWHSFLCIIPKNDKYCVITNSLNCFFTFEYIDLVNHSSDTNYSLSSQKLLTIVIWPLYYYNQKQADGRPSFINLWRNEDSSRCFYKKSEKDRSCIVIKTEGRLHCYVAFP